MKGRPDTTEERLIMLLLAVVLLGAVWLAFAIRPVEAVCEYYPPNPPNEPTGVKGCEIYGTGTASMWGGPGVARNDCVYPWAACQPIRITSLDTGITVDAVPRMFCDCYTGTANQRIVDLDPPTVAALGLDPALGLWRVTVEPIAIPIDGGVVLPDTAMETIDFILIMVAGGLISIAGFVVGYSMVRPRRR